MLISRFGFCRYMTARLISDKDLHMIRKYDKRSPEVQEELLSEVIIISFLKTNFPPPSARTHACIGMSMAITSFQL